MMAPASLRPAEPTRPRHPRPVPAPTRPTPREPARAYPPIDSRQDFGHYHRWQKVHQPLSYAWEHQALPWLVQACRQAKSAAHQGAQRVGATLEELRAEAPERTSPLFAWCAGNVHRARLASGEWLLSPQLRSPRQWTAQVEQHRERFLGEKSGLGDDDWLMPD